MAKKESSPDDMITTAEAAAELGISTIRVTQLITRGRLRATKFGPVWAIRRADLEAVRHRPTGRPRKSPEPDAKEDAADKKKSVPKKKPKRT